LNQTFNNAGSFLFDTIPEPRWEPINTRVPIAPFLRPGLTVCDLIRPSRAAMAASVGCPVAAPAGSAPPSRP
jgi:hypothetical protein